MLARGLIVTALLALPFAAQAQSYRCVGKDGKKYYGSAIPQQCIGQPVEQLNAQGMVIRRYEQAQTSEAERAAKAAEAQKKREEDAIAKEERRRNNALLATYTSEKDIEDARGRALADNQKAVKEVEQRIAEIRKRQAAYNKEMEFYSEGAKTSEKAAKGKPAATPARAAPKPPPKLVEDLKVADTDLKVQEALLATKKKEVDSINAKYDEDRKRYLDLTKGRK